MPEPSFPEDFRNRPAGEMVDDVLKRSQDALRAGAEATAELEKALEAGARATAEANELRRRAEESLDWRMQMRRHPWIPLAAAASAAIVLYLLLARRD